MPCDDCSRADDCPPCVNDTEPCRTQFPEGPCAGTRLHPGDCTANADDIAPPEPEAPDCEHPDGCPDRALCAPGCGFADQLQGVRLMPRPEGESPRRPPYAVAYAIEGGAQYEIALSGDATIRAEDGALIITHASAVLALTQARPMEGA